jgi:hypothetical protein
MCKRERNTTIPIFSSDLREFDDDAARSVAGEFLTFIQSEQVVADAIEILAHHVLILEARFSSRPEVLFDANLRRLYRNLWLTVVLLSSQRTIGQREAKAPHPLSRLVRLMMDSVSRRPREKVTLSELLKAAQKVRCPDEMMLNFMRQTLLFGGFMLGIDLNPTEAVVDWDVILDPASLTKIFGATHAEEVEGVRPIDLPDDWVELLVEPYEIDIENMEESTSICLLTQTIVTPGPFRVDQKWPTVIDYMMGTWLGGPILILHLTGPKATQVTYTTRQFGQYLRSRPVWVDQNGMPDYGLYQGKYLTLDRAALNDIFDDFLSGKFHDLMHVD